MAAAAQRIGVARANDVTQSSELGALQAFGDLDRLAGDQRGRVGAGGLDLDTLFGELDLDQHHVVGLQTGCLSVGGGGGGDRLLLGAAGGIVIGFAGAGAAGGRARVGTTRGTLQQGLLLVGGQLLEDLHLLGGGGLSLGDKTAGDDERTGAEAGDKNNKTRAHGQSPHGGPI